MELNVSAAAFSVDMSCQRRRKRSRSRSLRLCALVLSAWGTCSSEAYLHPSKFRRKPSRQSFGTNRRIPSRVPYRATLEEKDLKSEIKTDIELASHNEEDKVEYGRDMIGGSINISSIELSEKQLDKNGHKEPSTTRSMWRKRHARSAEEGIRREKTSQLSSLLAKAGSVEANGRRYAARTISGLINALAEEVDDLDVEVDARRDTPLSGKHVDAIRIKFSRLGFKPLQMGGLQDAVREYDKTFPEAGSSNPIELTDLSCADEAFERIDEDQSGALDSDEIAKALNLAAGSTDDSDERKFSVIRDLASDLVQLYDFNGDGVVDRNEYQSMVEDMAALRKAQEEMEEKEIERAERKEDEGWFSGLRHWMLGMFGGETKNETVANVTSQSQITLVDANDTLEEVDIEVNGSRDEASVEVVSEEAIVEEASQATMKTTPQKIVDVSDSAEVMDSVAKTLGSITFSDLKLDLRRLLFGAIPVLKYITPGGPLILEPFTTTITGSFTSDDIMNSFLLDAGLRRLVARALRRRVRSLRDFMDGAVFYGRRWNLASASAPVVEVPELSNVEFDSDNRLIITGRARVRTNPASPVIENAFKVRTRIGTRRGGRVIRLVEPELAFVLECPRSWEDNLTQLYQRLDWNHPVRPEPIYKFFPIYSPFKINDNDGFDLGEDNVIKAIYVKDNALRFELSAVLRPGRFLGNHYVAFTVPNRTFIITLDRVKEGMKAARKRKQAVRALEKQTKNNKEKRVVELESSLQQVPEPRNGQAAPKQKSAQRPQPKSFFSRFVDGYLSVERDEDHNERLTTAIRDWFSRQGTSNNNNSDNSNNNTE